MVDVLAAKGSESPVSLRPVVATVWDGPAHTRVAEPGRPDGLAELHAADRRRNTIWIETQLESLDDDEEAWFDGSYDIWKSMENPAVDWGDLHEVLEAAGLPTPAIAQKSGEPTQSTFLRAIPYVYTRGVFGTIRDALPDDEATGKLVPFVHGDHLTAFPAVGFQPFEPIEETASTEYVMLRTVVAVVDGVVLTIRMPDRICTAEVAGGSRRSNVDQVRLILPRRFLPLRRMPQGRELAEAIGIHQATTARGVANEIRVRLTEHEETAQALAHRQKGGRESIAELRDNAFAATEDTDRQAEIAQQLDRKIAQILRRHGRRDGEVATGAARLAPAEVERRYEFALDEIRSLHEDCRLTSSIVRQALTDHDQRQGEQFQFFAAVLASIVLIPTLIAGIFGANVHVPAEDSQFGFTALVTVIVGLVVASLYALQKARNHGWDAPRGEFLVPAAATVAIVIAYGCFLVLS